MIRAAIDTNVVVAALRSETGASNELLELLLQGRWQLVLSNTVLGEYHEILHREAAVIGLSHARVDAFLDGLCSMAEQVTLVTDWQPVANDPDDEPIVQLARESRVSYLVTHNVRDVAPAERFGVRVVRPGEFLNLVRQTL